MKENSDNYPKIISADQDSVFMCHAYYEILHKYNIILDVYVKSDHNALGIIDAYGKRLKLQLAKYIVDMTDKHDIIKNACISYGFPG